MKFKYNRLFNFSQNYYTSISNTGTWLYLLKKIFSNVFVNITIFNSTVHIHLWQIKGEEKRSRQEHRKKKNNKIGMYNEQL